MAGLGAEDCVFGLCVVKLYTKKGVRMKQNGKAFDIVLLCA